MQARSYLVINRLKATLHTKRQLTHEASDSFTCILNVFRSQRESAFFEIEGRLNLIKASLVRLDLDSRISNDYPICRYPYYTHVVLPVDFTNHVFVD